MKTETAVKPQHTPLPWEVGQNKHEAVYIVSQATRQNVVDLAAVNLANATLIVRAVNAHEELVTLLRRALASVGASGIGGSWCKDAREAIAKAEAQ